LQDKKKQYICGTEIEGERGNVRTTLTSAMR